MKFKTRLWITFVTIIILPVILTSIAFGVISYQVIHKEGLSYGIEINDFAVTVAKTAMWIAESQMMKETEGEDGRPRDCGTFLATR